MSGSRFLAPTTPGAMLSPGSNQVTPSELLTLQAIDNNVFFVLSEIPTGLINGVNVTFTIAHTPSPSSSLEVWLGGQKLQLTTDYTFDNNVTITMNNAPATGQILMVNYFRHP